MESREETLYKLIQKISSSSSVASFEDISALKFLLQGVVAPVPDVIPGVWYNVNELAKTLVTSSAVGTGDIMLAPFSFRNQIEFDSLGFTVASSAANSRFQILMYSSNSAGYPENLIYKSKDLISNSTGLKAEQVSFKISDTRLYWAGLHVDGAPSFDAIPSDSLYNLGTSSSSKSVYNYLLQTGITYGEAPEKWSFTTAQLRNVASFPSLKYKGKKSRCASALCSEEVK